MLHVKEETSVRMSSLKSSVRSPSVAEHLIRTIIIRIFTLVWSINYSHVRAHSWMILKNGRHASITIQPSITDHVFVYGLYEMNFNEWHAASSQHPGSDTSVNRIVEVYTLAKRNGDSLLTSNPTDSAMSLYVNPRFISTRGNLSSTK